MPRKTQTVDNRLLAITLAVVRECNKLFDDCVPGQTAEDTLTQGALKSANDCGFAMTDQVARNIAIWAMAKRSGFPLPELGV